MFRKRYWQTRPRWMPSGSSSAPTLPASFANCEAAGHCRFTTANRDCRHPPVRRKLTVRLIVPQMATTVVSRGDSLWQISRVKYDTGMRYAVVYRNREQIRNPNRIYPGQIFVLPMKAR